MIEQLAADQDAIVAAALKVARQGEQCDDPASADLGVRRVDIHEKNAWMLRSHLA